MATSLLLGGGGERFPLPAMFTQLASIPLLVVVAAAAPKPLVTRRTLIPLLILLAIVVLIAAQLVPLASSIWGHLPGREVVRATAEALGMGAERKPLSVDPESTVAAALTLLPAFALFLAALALRDGQLRKLLGLTAVLLAVHLFVGILQVTSGGTRFYLYWGSSEKVAVGLFTNRNHLGTLLLLGCLCIAVIVRRERAGPRRLIIGVIALLGLGAGIIATGSRTAALLLPLALLAVPFVAGWVRSRKAVATAGVALLALTILCAALIWASAGHSPAGRLLARFVGLNTDNESRFGIWEDTAFAAMQYFPAGSGLGTYKPVYNSLERFTQVGSHYANHAHNDYLELLLETGLVGGVLMLLFLGWFLTRGLSAWVRPAADPDRAALSRAAAVGLMLILLHSMVDYPLRTAAIMSLFGLFAGILARSEKAVDGSRRRPRLAPLLVLAAPLTAIVLVVGISRSAFATHNLSLAQSLWGARGAAFARSAEELRAGGDTVAAEAHARAALDQSFAHPAAIRVLGLNAEARGDTESAEEIMIAAARWGWRDSPTQVWLLRRAFLNDDLGLAYQHMDALLRQQEAREALFSLMIASVEYDPDSANDLVGHFEVRPTWRSAFFTPDSNPSWRSPGFLAILRALAGTSAHARREEVLPFVSALARDQRLDQAAELWHLAGGAIVAIAGPGEIQLDWSMSSPASPFDWQYESTGGGSPLVRDEGDQHALVLGREAGRTVAARTILIAPGRYALGIGRLVDPGGVRLSLRCGTAETAAAPQTGAQWVAVVPPGCRAAQLRVTVPAAVGEALILRPVRIRRLP